MPSSRKFIAERPGFANSDVLSRSPAFLKGAKHFIVSANCDLLDEPTRLSAVTRRKAMKLKHGDIHELSAKWNVGECWYMDWRRE